MSISKMFLASFCVILVTACSTAQQEEWFVNHSGNMPAKERIARIEVGNSKDDVINTLGMPSSINAFDENSWVYMSSDIKTLAFMPPEEINRDVLKIRFNNADEVIEIENLTLADGADIAPNKDKTEVKGQRPGFFKKYFGGVGQYTPFSTKGNNGL